MFRTLKPAIKAGLSAVALSFGFAMPAQALDDKSSGSARINLAAKLRNTAQEIAADACIVVHAHGSAGALEKLADAHQRMDALLDALQYGDSSLGLEAAEPLRKVQTSLKSLRDAWAPEAVYVDRILAGADQEQAYAEIAQLNAEMLKRTEGLLAVISGSYSNSETFPIAATLAVNIAVRQQMLMRQIERLHCEITAKAPGYEQAQAELAQLIGLFDASMTALQNGEPSVGLMVPPTEAIKGSLTRAADQWAELRDVYRAVSETGVSPMTEAQEIAAVEGVIKSLQNVQVLYILGTSSQPDIYRVPLKRYAETELARWVEEPTLIVELRAQNQAHSGLQQVDIDALDQQWRAEAKAGGGALIEGVLARPTSGYLRQAQQRTAGLVTEVFAMDNRGLNVGQSQVTSDYWQGDEDKWQQTFPAEGDAMHFSDVEYDDSTGFYQVQVSMPISDPNGAGHIGAITFGVNIQTLF